MLKLRAIAIGTAVLMAGAASVVAQTPIKNIDVSIDTAAISNAAAARRFATVDNDLEDALSNLLEDRMGPEGITVNVDLSEVELSNFFEEAFDFAQTKMVGDVMIRNSTLAPELTNYQLSIMVDDITPIAAAEASGAELFEGTDEYYDLLIAAFAEAVAVRLNP